MSEQQNTQQPVARISLHRVDGVPRATLLQTLGGAAVLPIGEIDVYAAPVAAANDPVPRDVLMALGEAVRTTCFNACDESGGDMGAVACVNVAALADRYASQVQPEQANPLDAIDEVMELRAWRAALRGLCVGRELLTPDECAENVRHQLRTAKKAAAAQPEPVNQQMLAALKECVQALDQLDVHSIKQADAYDAAEAAIAAAEKEQGHD